MQSDNANNDKQFLLSMYGHIQNLKHGQSLSLKDSIKLKTSLKSATSWEYRPCPNKDGTFAFTP